MRFAVRLLGIFGGFLLLTGIAFSFFFDQSAGIAVWLLLFANAAFFFFIAIMIRAAPAMEYMRENRETAVDRDPPRAALKEAPAPPPPPAGVHIPGPSFWPALVAIGALLVGAGLVFRKVEVNLFLAVGVVVLVFVLAGWAVQAWNERDEVLDHEDHDAGDDTPAALEERTSG